MPALRPFVAVLWAQRASEGSVRVPELGLEALRANGGLEHVLPTGAIHVVFRLGPTPLRVFDAAGRAARFHGAVVGGPRAHAYLKDVTASTELVGMQLRVGAAALIFPGSATALAGAHTPLDALWGPEAERLRAQLEEEPDLARRLDRLEAALLVRARAMCPRPELAPAIAHLARGGSLADAVARSGLGARRFRSVFADAVGLAPKVFARVARAGRALEGLADPRRSLASIALEAGFSDQAHFQRELKEIIGLSPGVYRSREPVHPHHVRA